MTNKTPRQELSEDEKYILQILIARHKTITFGVDGCWMIDMIVLGEFVYHICIDHTLVTSLREKGLIKRELNNIGKSCYTLTATNAYEDIINEMRVRKALGVEVPKNTTLKVKRIK